jgi:glycine cleavage system P protein (glycine dehydrogenase) subunit 1
MTYIPHTKQEVADMLSTIGVAGLDELFTAIPEDARDPQMDMPPAISEPELQRLLAQRFSPLQSICLSFAGGGAYSHMIPAATWHLAGRSEFYTAYTPYQAEASQGTLQAIFEYQTMMCRLTGMDVSNASMYDGATALAESSLMALRKNKKRKKIVMSSSINPAYREVVRTYLSCQPVEIVEPEASDGVLTADALGDSLNDAACLILQYPNFYGCVEDMEVLVAKAHDAGALVIVSAYPVALGLLKSPGELGADICCGDLQPFGIPLSFGGPYCGYMTCTTSLMRMMPGRIIGQTTDKDGNIGYCLTLQTREQHIRREKATSNICTNQGLFALAASITMALLGKQGLREMAQGCVQNAHYAQSEIAKIDGITTPNTTSFFNEFVVRFESAEKLQAAVSHCLEKGIQPGIPLTNYGLDAPTDMLVSVTELYSKEDIDALCEILGEKT